MRRLLVVLAVACAGMAAWTAAAGGQKPTAKQVDPGSLLLRGRTLFAQGCASCHDEDLRGRPGLGPNLRGAGAAAADFYLSTGRMPLANPTDEPTRNPPAYPKADIAALVAYVGSFGGTRIPRVDPSKADLPHGLEQFTERCAGCHQVVAKGGIVTGAAVPTLREATARQLAEAVRIGPYVMPRFSKKSLSDAQLDSIVRYVEYAKHPDDRGGWAIGHLGPIPEGLVTWLLGMTALVAVCIVIGKRLKSE